MARRYSGDVELHIRHRGGRGRSYDVLLKTPRSRMRLRAHLASNRPPASPEAYDAVARKVLGSVLARRPSLPVERGTFGRLVVRRVFQAPCPMAPASGRGGWW